MPRYPQIWLTCRALDRAERRDGPPSIESRRAATAQLPAPTGAVAPDLTITEEQVPVERGHVRVRIHTPTAAQPKPVHLLMHAGAFCYGAPRELDALAAVYARQAGCVVVVPEYGLAPEHPYPTGIEDCYAVLTWLVAHAERLGIDAARISVGGVSAGGAIAAALTLAARDRSGPPILFQLLEVPVTDLTGSCPSRQAFRSGYVLTQRELARGARLYEPDATRRREAYASPLFAPDLAGLPPALVLTCEFDPLRDEGEAYAGRLADAGVPVEVIRARGHVHSSTYSAMRSAQRLQQRAARALAEAYSRS